MPKPIEKCPNDPLTPIDINLLQADPFYQRGISNRQVNQIYNNYNKKMLSPPIVAERRDGTYWIIDGQQRVQALRKRGCTHVRVMLIKVKNTMEEAELFVQINKAPKPLSTRDNYKACVFRKTNVALAIEDILEEQGLTAKINDGTDEGRNEISAIGKYLEAWGNNIPVYQHYDLTIEREREHFQFGKEVWRWTVDALMPLINRGWNPKKVFHGSIAGAVIWLAKSPNNSKSMLAKVRKAIVKAETFEDLRFAVTQTKTSPGGSRRDLFGVRLCYWLNQQQAKPFIALTREEWMLLPLNGHQINIDNDPAILIRHEKKTS